MRRNSGKPAKRETERGEGTVLIIEDAPDVMEITSETLKRLGYTVIEAAAGREAVEKARSEAVDAALLDIKLPDMSGAQVYPLIMEAKPGLKVIVYSGYELDGPAKEIMDAAADGFIQKPFSVKGISVKLKEILKR